MARIKIDFPQKHPAFHTKITVLIQHINYGGHLSNDAILSIAHESRLRYLKSIGCSELDAFGAGLIMTDAAIVYQGEGFQGDLLNIDIVAGEFTSRSFDLFYKMSCEREGVIVAIAELKTGLLCFDYQKRRPTLLPSLLKEALNC